MVVVVLRLFFVMKRWIDQLTLRLRNRTESLLLIGLYSWVVIYRMEVIQAASWRYYLYDMLALMIVMLPVLYFSWNKIAWKERLAARTYWLRWLLVYVVYVPAALLTWLLVSTPGWHLQHQVGLCLGLTLILEFVLLVNAFFRDRWRQWKWIRKISFEKAILLCILLVCVMLSVMAVSSIGNPEYDYPNRLLLGFEFNIVKVVTRFPVFLAYTIQFLIMYAGGYLLFYLNNRVLVPMILKKQGVLIYCLIGLALVGVLYPIIGQVLAWLPFNKRLGYVFSANPFKPENGYAAVLILLITLPVVLALQWSRQNQTIMSLMKEKAEAELELLHQQLNPHFFFNTLNNLYALSLSQAKETPETILQLSALMRYTIYRSKEPAVNIVEEIRYLEDYIQLQQMRLKRKPDIRFERSVPDGAPPVAPLLFIVLVENAFKHGIEPATEPALLHLTLTVAEKHVRFVCTNSVDAPILETAAGIGLKNLRRRLELLYPGKHRFSTLQENHTFKAELELDLS